VKHLVAFDIAKKDVSSLTRSKIRKQGAHWGFGISRPATMTASTTAAALRANKGSNMKSAIIKRSIERKASVCLEEEFWQGLEEIAQARNMSLSPLILAIRERHKGSLPSAVRVFVYSTMVAGSWLQRPQVAPDHSR
jgi:predicted DNA-binding ribbon-helix-helix protein